MQFHIRRGAGNTQEAFASIRRVQTMEALSQFPVCISGPMCQFWHLTRSISDGAYKNFVLLHSHIPISIDMGYHLCLPADSAALIIQIGQYFFALLHFHILIQSQWNEASRRKEKNWGHEGNIGAIQRHGRIHRFRKGT